MLALLVAACFLLARAAAARLDRRLLLPAGADRLPARSRDRARDRPAGQAARARRSRRPSRWQRWGGGARARRRERSHGRRQRRLARRAARPAPLPAGRSPARCSWSSRRSPPPGRSTSPSHGIATVGPVAGGLPRPTLPTPPLADVLELVPAALGVFLVSFADEILTARAFAGKRGEHVRASQELLVMGAANAAAGFTQAFSVGASGARTAVNEAMGARTQIAGLFAAGDGRRRAALPDRAGAVPACGRARRRARRRSRSTSSTGRLAGAGGDRPGRGRDRRRSPSRCVVFFGVLEAIVVAVGLSIIDTVRRSARPYDAVLGWVPELEGYRDVALHPSARGDPGRRRLPARRPALLRQRALRQGPRARGDPRRADRDLLARVRRGGGQPRRLDRNRGAPRPAPASSAARRSRSSSHGCARA